MPNLPPTHEQRLGTVEQRAAVAASVANSSADALRQLTHGHKPRVVCHYVALVVEFIGTLFIFLDALRFNARFPPDALFTVGDPIPYRHWWFHQAPLGFLVLLLGIVSQGYLLWIENDAIRRATKALAQAR
jgi:hypothetical protein